MEQVLTNSGVCLSVVSHGQASLLHGLLADLLRLRPPLLRHLIITRNVPEPFDPPTSAPFEIEVIDGAVRRGFGANHNAAFSRCRERYFVVCNPDIRLKDDPFPVLLTALRSGRSVAAPAVVDPAGNVEDSARPLLTPLDVVMRRLGDRRADFGQPAWLAGMFLAFRADSFRALRGFDEKFFMYCEDADICARAVLHADGIAFCPQATVVHAARRASRRAFGPLQWHVASLVKFWFSPTFRAYRRYLRSDNVRPTLFRAEVP